MKPRDLLPLLPLLIAAPAWSAPTISLNWESCTGPINQANTGSHAYSLYISVVGMDRPHTAYQVDVGFGTTENTTPDAWFYDVVDYGELVVPQPAVSVHPTAEMSKVCPALSGDLRGIYITATRPRPAEDLAFPTGTMQFLISIAYPDKMMDFDPNQRYFIARIEFDHSTSVEGEGVPGTSRGGFEQPIQFRLNGKRCTFLAIDGMTEYPFDVSNGAVLATFGGSPSLTPAAATTWGQIKSQYRR